MQKEINKLQADNAEADNIINELTNKLTEVNSNFEDIKAQNTELIQKNIALEQQSQHSIEENNDSRKETLNISLSKSNSSKGLEIEVHKEE